MTRANTRWRTISERLIHILDEKLENCEYLSTIFRLEGFKTQFSISSRDYFSSSAQNRPDMVFLSADLNGGHGLQLLQTIRAQRQGVAVVVTTEQPDVELTVAAMKAGAHEVFCQALQC